MEKHDTYSASKTLMTIVIYFLLFLCGDLLNSLIFDLLFSFVKLSVREFYVIIRMSGCLALTYLFFWLYTTRGLRLKMSSFGITFGIKRWGILFAVFLPAFAVFTFLLVGRAEMGSLAFSSIILAVAASVITALKAGILEEMLFRGFIMRLLEKRWNKFIAILAPSFIFSIIIPSDSILLTGAGFGMEASLIAMVGYACICVMTLWGRRK